MKKQKNFLLLLFFLFGIVLMIFMFSAQNGEKSANVSQIFTEKFLSIFSVDDISFGKMEHLLRKTAHFIEFFALGVLLCLLFTRFLHSEMIAGLLSFVAAVLYAVADECHQYFIPGRSASLKDILLDGAGAFCGILLTLLIRITIHYVWKRRQNKRDASFSEPLGAIDKSSEL